MKGKPSRAERTSGECHSLSGNTDLYTTIAITKARNANRGTLTQN